ncbi:MAG: hypothetical protein JXB42_05930, partial [Deltaproteobacteria bacterium]|nr:hypothetical protein [Deltaproteobacteria bacterium]
MNTLYIKRPFHNTPSCHSGLDPESRKHVITLDTGLRRYDAIAGFIMLCKGLNKYIKNKKPGGSILIGLVLTVMIFAVLGTTMLS